MELLGGVGVFVGAAAIGLVHGAEPGHGWPIAAAYALDRERTWFHGFVASSLLGLGHLISSIAVVLAFFLAKSYFELDQIGWIRYVAGALLIGMGIREYYHHHDHGHSHDSESEHDHATSDGVSKFATGADHTTVSTAPTDGHGHQHDADRGWLARTRAVLPLGGHSHGSGFEDADSKGLAGLVTTAFVLGFVHEEEFEIIGLCLGSNRCLALMLVYALAVIVGLVGLTLLLIAGYVRYEERVESYAEYLPTISAVVLILMGLGFITGVL